MQHLITTILEDSIRTKRQAIETQLDALIAAADMLVTCIASGHKILLFGNGGSAADAQHIAAEFVNRFQIERRPLPALALTTDTSVITSIGNDYDFDQIFAKQIQALGQRDDVAWGATYEEMRNANGDSFHLTNCTPQVAGFNRSRNGVDNWGDLENLILRQADSFNIIWLIGLFFFGIHLILLGKILGRPRLIAVFLALAGFMYMVDTGAHFLLPDYDNYASIFLAMVAIPSIGGEMALSVWLLVKGGRWVHPQRG